MKQIDWKEHKREDLLLDDTSSLELPIVDECQVVLLDPVLYCEEQAHKHTDQGVRPTEDKAHREKDNSLWLEIAQVEAEVVYKGFLLYFLLLRLFVCHVLEELNEVMRYVKQLNCIRYEGDCDWVS